MSDSLGSGVAMDISIASSGPNQQEYPHLPPTDVQVYTHILHSFTSRSLLSPIYAFLFQQSFASADARFIHASRGLVVARLLLAPQHINSGGSLHGSTGATIVDWIGGLAIASWDLRDGTGVSVDINVSYLGGAKVGETVEIEGRADRVGGSVAFTSVSIFAVEADGVRGRPLVLGRHTKFVGAGKRRT